MKLDGVWRAHRQWAVFASHARDSLDRWRAINLSLILLGAVAGALAAQPAWFSSTATTVLGAVSGGVLAVAGVVQLRVLTPESVQRRVLARATSEALEGVAFRYLANVPSTSGRDRDSELTSAVTEVARLAGDRAVLIVGIEPDDRALPQVDGIGDYVRERAVGQRDWHEHRTADHQLRGRRWRAAEFAATAAAAVLAAVGGAWHGPNLSAWVAVTTTAAAAFAAHLASQQHDRIAASYARTVVSLNSLLDDFDPVQASVEQASRFVADVESVLAQQNDSWVSLFTAK